MQIRLDDGVHQSTMTVKLNIVNTPPMITCTSLTTNENTPVSITAANCASDLNGDSVTLTASNPVHGKLQPSGGGVNFVPDTGFIGTGQVTLSATDGSAQPVSADDPDHVVAPAAIAVTIAGDASRAARTDRPIYAPRDRRRLPPTPADQVGVRRQDVDDQGQYVSHLFHDRRAPTTSPHRSATTARRAHHRHRPEAAARPQADDVDGNGTVGLRVQLANAGKLTVGMVGVPGMHPMKQ